MVKRRGMLFAVVLVTAAGLIATPAAAKSTATVPGAPTITAVLAGRHGATFSFTPPAGNGGARITRYRVHCKPFSGGGPSRTGYSHTMPLFVSLRAGGSYSCTIAAGNRVGFGPESVSIGAVVDPDAGTHCTGANGTATFTPPLPKLGKASDKNVVDTVLMMTGTLDGCTLGGVTSATTSLVSNQITAASCATFAAGSTPPIIATLTITWNTQATSTIPVRIQAPRSRPTSPVLIGTVTAGLFPGLHLTSTLGFSLGKTGCTSADLSTVTYKQLTPTDIA
jgi:Fibronectin type III domain